MTSRGGRMRRNGNGGGGGAWTPAALSPAVWRRADNVTLNGSDVARVINMGSAGSDLDAAQGTASLQPAYTASNPNFSGAPTLDGTGTEYLPAVTPSSLPVADDDDVTIVAIFRSNAAAEGGYFGEDATGAGFTIFRRSGGDFRGGADDGGTGFNVAGGGSVGLTNVHVGRLDFVGQTGPTNDTLRIRLDGGTPATGANNLGVFNSVGGTILAKDATGLFPAAAEWAEDIVIMRALTAGELASLAQYLRDRYGLTLASGV